MRLRREMAQRNERLEVVASLIGGVAHELNNPLALLVGHATLLRRKAGDGPLADRADKIAQAAERCARIVRNFLGLARRQGPDRRPLDLGGLVKETLEILSNVYGTVITAGIHRAPSIKVAEAAKVIENSQRDINIAFMNELAIIFNRMGLDTAEVLAAAGTKWNFLKFRPGLVGGHCIGVDPYYLTYQAEKFGHHAEVILSGRRINAKPWQVAAVRASSAIRARRRSSPRPPSSVPRLHRDSPARAGAPPRLRRFVRER